MNKKKRYITNNVITSKIDGLLHEIISTLFNKLFSAFHRKFFIVI